MILKTDDVTSEMWIERAVMGISRWVNNLSFIA